MKGVLRGARRPFGLTLVLVVVSLVAAPASGATPLPQVTGPLPVTAESYPFGAADHQLVPQDLAKSGYVEEEYLVSGLANVYDWPQSGPAAVRTPTRLIRRGFWSGGRPSARSSAATSSSKCSTRRTSSI